MMDGVKRLSKTKKNILKFPWNECFESPKLKYNTYKSPVESSERLANQGDFTAIGGR